ncbi:MAG: DUF438 domain-containing protein [Spirochaetota bacterium]
MEQDRQRKKEAMRDIIRKLHQGISVEQARERFEREVGAVSSMEIAEIEQSLIDEGMSPEEIKKFCNVHALLFQSSLEKSVSREESPVHPVTLFRKENREIEKLVGEIRSAAGSSADQGAQAFAGALREPLARLRDLERHYTRKEQLLFPYLEKHGFLGPSKVMWGKDDEIRDLLRKAAAELEQLPGDEQVQAYRSDVLDPLLEEVEGMILKEESILFPTALEKLGIEEWAEVLKDSEQVGYAFIDKPQEAAALADQLLVSYLEEPGVTGQGRITLPTGELSPRELLGMLNTLPVDLTFIDGEDRVRYFSEGRDRIFLRTRSVLGRSVQNCHPPQSVDAVNAILDSFKQGTRNSAEFWIKLRGRLVYIRYFPVRDRDGTYLGTLEVTQDVTGIKALEGEKRLLDEGD